MESYLNRKYKKKQAEQQNAAGGASTEAVEKQGPAQGDKKDQLSSETSYHVAKTLRILTWAPEIKETDRSVRFTCNR